MSWPFTSHLEESLGQSETTGNGEGQFLQCSITQ